MVALVFTFFKVKGNGIRSSQSYLMWNIQAALVLELIREIQPEPNNLNLDTTGTSEPTLAGRGHCWQDRFSN